MNVSVRICFLKYHSSRDVGCNDHRSITDLSCVKIYAVCLFLLILDRHLGVTSKEQGTIHTMAKQQTYAWCFA